MSEHVGSATEQGKGPLPRLLLYVCFFLSGLTALVYQIVWFRNLHHIFGSTVYSVSAVLVGFMGGLGAGSYLLGRVADRHRSPARLYGLFELCIGLWALLTPWLFVGVGHAFSSVQAWLDWGPAPALLVKLLFTLPVLLVPTVLMGGTLPTLARAMTRWDSGVHDELGRLYGINTLGAMVGAAATGFLLLEALGTGSSLLLAAALNIGVGALIWLRVRRWEREVGEARAQGSTGDSVAPRRPASGAVDDVASPAAPVAAQPGEPGVRWELRFAIAGIAATGAASMLFELVWTRALAVLSGASAYSFTLVLTVVLAGLGTGSAAYGVLARRSTPRPRHYAFILLALALSAGLTVPLLGLLPRWMLYLRQVPGLGFGDHMRVQFGVAALLLLPPTLLMGAGLPLAMGLVARGRARLGHTVGKLYLINTAAGVLGSLAGGFVLITTLGSQSTLVLAVVVLALLGAVGAGLFARGRTARTFAAAVAALTVVICLQAPRWETALFNAGAAYRFGKESFDSRLELERFLVNSASRLVSLREGRDATVAVRQMSWTTTMIINGKPDASSGEDMPTQMFLGLLPGLLHPGPRDAFVVGYGSGVTAHAIASFPTIQRVEVVEIEAEVVHAGRFFADVNGDLAQNPNVHVVVDDARSRLQGTRRLYDVIISEPSNLHLAGTANLFTSEFYALVRRRLQPGGIFAQWVHLYRLQGPVLGVVLRTLSQAFPHVQVWAVDPGNLAILCAEEPLPLDPSAWAPRIAANPVLQESLQRWWNVERPEGLLGHFLLDPGLVQYYLERLPPGVHTDGAPLLEFMALREAYGPGQHLIDDIWLTRVALQRWVPPELTEPVPAATILAAASLTLSGRQALRTTLANTALRLSRAAAATPGARTGAPLARLASAQLHLEEGAPALALEQLDREWPALQGDARAVLLRGRALASLGRLQEARDGLARVPERLAVEAEVALAAAEEASGQLPAAHERRLRVLEGMQSGRYPFHVRLPVESLFGDLHRLAERLGAWEPLTARLRDERMDPRGEIPRRAALAMALVAQGQPADALEELELLERSFDVVDPSLLELTARCLVAIGRPAEAEERWRRLLELNPGRVGSVLRLGGGEGGGRAASGG